MKFSEAKQRKDYKFTLNEIEDLIEDIRNNYMKNLYENGDGYRGAAIYDIISGKWHSFYGDFRKELI